MYLFLPPNYFFFEENFVYYFTLYVRTNTYELKYVQLMYLPMLTLKKTPNLIPIYLLIFTIPTFLMPNPHMVTLVTALRLLIINYCTPHLLFISINKKSYEHYKFV